MKIIVFNVAAESGGALTILKKYYNDALKNKNYEWHFIVSTPNLKSKDNVHIHKYQWVKKSWIHRLFFDLFIANKIVKKLNGDVAFSLQNLLIPFVKTEQVVYFHQVLPFSKKKFTIFENPLFWIYQNIIGKLILYSIKKADKVIVQAKWIKTMFIKEYNLSPNRIIVEAPDLDIKVNKKFETAINRGKILYFYPASAATYKNHKLIIEVVKELVKESIENFEIIFTLKGDENPEIKKLKAEVYEDNLPVTFIGELSLSEVYDMYSKSILLFPSYLESYPLPLEEAKVHNTPIIVSNLEYAKDILKEHNRVKYISPFSNSDLFEIIKNLENSLIEEGKITFDNN